MERRDRGGQISVRFNNPDKPGVEKRDRKSLGLVVRAPRTGRLDQKLVRAAELPVQQCQAKLLVGHSPPHDDSVAPSKAAPSAAPPTASAATSLTIRAGFDLALDPERGKYGSNRTRRYDQMVERRERLFGGRRPPVTNSDRRSRRKCVLLASAFGATLVRVNGGSDRNTFPVSTTSIFGTLHASSAIGNTGTAEERTGRPTSRWNSESSWIDAQRCRRRRQHCAVAACFDHITCLNERGVDFVLVPGYALGKKDRADVRAELDARKRRQNR